MAESIFDYEAFKAANPDMFTPVYCPGPDPMDVTAYQVIPANMESSMYTTACSSLDGGADVKAGDAPVDTYAGRNPMECTFYGLTNEDGEPLMKNGLTFEQNKARNAAHLAKNPT